MYVHTHGEQRGYICLLGPYSEFLEGLLRGKTDPLADSCSLCYMEEENLTGDTYTEQSKVDEAASPYSSAFLTLFPKNSPTETGGSRLRWKHFMRRMDQSQNLGSNMLKFLAAFRSKTWIHFLGF